VPELNVVLNNVVLNNAALNDAALNNTVLNNSPVCAVIVRSKIVLIAPLLSVISVCKMKMRTQGSRSGLCRTRCGAV
jgi:hypothetical protein